MATVIRGGPTKWSMARDAEGHREYKITYQVECLSAADGPTTALKTPGLPVPGSYWIIGNDIDLWATCRWDAEVTPRLDREPNRFFDITFTFSTKPVNSKACRDVEVDDPLLEPTRISGSFTKYTEEATTDRFGRAVVNSAHEQLSGAEIEFDVNRPQIRIEKNVASFSSIVLAYGMIDCVNNATLWGFSRRCIKLSNISWERKFHGACYAYYSLVLEFDVRPDGSFDRNILDEATMVLNGNWLEDAWVLADVATGVPPNPVIPHHFIRATDKKGNFSKIILNGRGLPAEVLAGTAGLFISIADSNTGNSLSKATKWIPLTLTDIEQWDATIEYSRGQVVTDVGHTYVAIEAPVAGDVPGASANWEDIGILPLGLHNQGNYSALTTYSKGDYVKDAAQTSAGYIRVEKYPEANFLLLGVPVIF